MFSGVDFGTRLQEVIGHDHSAYFDSARTNDLIIDAFSKSIGLKYPDTGEPVADELYTLRKTGSLLTPVNNTVNIFTAIPDYIHLYALKNKFVVPLNATVLDATNQWPIVLTLNAITNLTDGSQISNSGFLGNTAANGEFYVKNIYNDYSNNIYAYELYSDKNLTVPVKGNGTYTSGGLTRRIIFNDAKSMEAYRKYSTFSDPTPSDSAFEIANGLLKILPLDIPCTQATIDYVSNPPTFPDVTNSTFDLYALFPHRFLLFWIDRTASLMFEESRDDGGLRNIAGELTQN